MADEQQRDRVRALVREVLDNALPADETSLGSREMAERDANYASGARAGGRTRFVDTLPSGHSDNTGGAPAIRDESSKTVITEDDVRGLERGAQLRIAEGARLTPLAADIVRDNGIEVVRRSSRRNPANKMTIAVGADHGGYSMKEELKRFLEERGHRVRDFGTNSTEPVDYPDFAHAVARAVADRVADAGIIIDGAGVGSAMTANKVPGVRAAACYSVTVARNSREHNGANVLTLGSGTIDLPLMKEIVQEWLATEIKEERHLKRVAKIDAVERQYKR
jgi:ribose 5-phosphate isomerase B